MSAHRENPAKIYVSVRADHLLNGRIRPLMFRAKDGPSSGSTVSSMSVKPRPSRRGGQGMRYTCRVGEKQLYLFHDDVYWFIEAE